MMQFISKAQNLKNLQHNMKNAKVLPMVITSLKEYQKNPKQVLDSIVQLKSELL